MEKMIVVFHWPEKEFYLLETWQNVFSISCLYKIGNKWHMLTVFSLAHDMFRFCWPNVLSTPICCPDVFEMSLKYLNDALFFLRGKLVKVIVPIRLLCFRTCSYHMASGYWNWPILHKICMHFQLRGLISDSQY